MSSDEHVSMPAVWVIELFPPSHISDLARAIEKHSWDKGRARYRPGESNQEILERSRAGRGWVWWQIGDIAAEGSSGVPGRTMRQELPAEFSNIEIHGLQIGEGLTAVLAQFRLSATALRHLDDVWHADHEPQLVWKEGHLHPEDRHWSGLRRTQEARRSVHRKARSWLRREMPGVFARNSQCQPLTDLLLLDRFDPFAESEIDQNFSSALRALGLSRFNVNPITCSNIPGLMLEKVDTGLCATFKDEKAWTLWGQRKSIAESVGDTSAYSDGIDGAVTYVLGEALREFLALLAIADLLELLDAKYAELRDKSRTRHGRFRGRRLRELREDFLTLSLDVSSLTRDIQSFNARTWRHENDVRFTLNASARLARALREVGKKEPDPIDLVDRWRAEYTLRARELAAIDKDYREVLSTVASLGTSIDTIKVSRIAIWVSLASLLVALVTLLVADIKPDAPLFALWQWISSALHVDR
ncbi:hypothetical protein [Nonomuraea zeae]|uniref:Uncharacterized protein n=1 Tax=Nonomuraea zeae TaxID=1642303 RepID=A0A5S4GWJ5_9ACTN|nr:hypothetical protein [Nonomuraea zeae]TMR37336.1 hypothetical protein ETD85_08315 [Nonomuraea zeae]